jgi:hypothetical protein
VDAVPSVRTTREYDNIRRSGMVWSYWTNKKERIAKNVFGKWRLGNRLPWKLRKKKRKKKTLEATI